MNDKRPFLTHLHGSFLIYLFIGIIVSSIIGSTMSEFIIFIAAFVVTFLALLGLYVFIGGNCD